MPFLWKGISSQLKIVLKLLSAAKFRMVLGSFDADYNLPRPQSKGLVEIYDGETTQQTQYSFYLLHCLQPFFHARDVFRFIDGIGTHL